MRETVYGTVGTDAALLRWLGRGAPGSRIDNPKQIQGLAGVCMHHRIYLNGRSG